MRTLNLLGSIGRRRPQPVPPPTPVPVIAIGDRDPEQLLAEVLRRVVDAPLARVPEDMPYLERIVAQMDLAATIAGENVRTHRAVHEFGAARGMGPVECPRDTDLQQIAADLARLAAELTADRDRLKGAGL